MNSQNKLLAAARRAAKIMARADDLPYQKCLDLVARRAGRSTWRAFLSNPAPVDERAAAAAGEPDFTTIDADQHYETAVRYGIGQGALTLTAEPRAWNDGRPVLSFGMPDGRDHPIDARGLDLDAFAASCLGITDGSHRPKPNHTEWADAMPVLDGSLMRAKMYLYRLGDRPLATIGIGLDGSDAPDIESPRPPSRSYERHDQAWSSHSLASRLRAKARHILGGDQRHALKAMKERGPLSRDDGPLVGHANGQAMRLRPGHNLLVMSPPGTGRLASVTFTALLSDDRSSYVVHDSGQHLEVTSGWRSTLGRVAVIRLDSESPDAINPLDAAWLPSDPVAMRRHVDAVMQAIVPGQPAMARLLTEAALRLVSRDGGTTLRAVRGELAGMLDHPLARRTIGTLAPLTTDGAHGAFGRNTVTPEELRGSPADGRPITIYVMRNPGDPSPRDILASAIQTAIWRRVLSYHPGDDRSKTAPGMAPEGLRSFVAMLPDLHVMPFMNDLTMACDLGRSKLASTIITSAAGGAIEERYGTEISRQIVASSHLRLALQQSNPGDMPFVDPTGQIGYETLSRLPQDRSWALTSNDLPPLLLKRSFYFDSPLSARSYNPRTGKGPRPYA